ncbi:MAG: helix-turn-helix domain-containing protein [Lactobacillaceae bacterium]
MSGKPLRLTDSRLSFYENGKRSPRNPEVWEAIARVFNVDVNYLLCTQKEPKRILLSKYINFLEESSEVALVY